jgi:predicted ATP-dependent protease
MNDKKIAAQPAPAPRLPVEALYRAVDPCALPYASTAELEPLDGVVGQPRALDAIRFGSRVRQAGFNLFVIGPAGVGMHDSVAAMLREAARELPTPCDYVYVHNFADADKPVAIELPPGRAARFRSAMHELIDDLRAALPALFQSEDYQSRRAAIDEAFQKKQEEAFSALRDKASGKDVVVVRTPFGFALAPTRDGQVVSPEKFAGWPEEQRRQTQEQIQLLEKDLEHIVHQIPQWEKQRRDEIRHLNRETVRLAVDQSIEETKAAFADLPQIVTHIEAVRADLVDNVAALSFRAENGEDEPLDGRPGGLLDRYEVNVLIAQSGTGAPVVEEFHPTLANLIGRIEYVPVRGALVTSFRHLKAGALHRANGGYLLLDVRNLLAEPYAWMALKRTLRKGSIVIEDIGRFLGFASMVSLDPDPIPLNVKIIVFGDRLLYFLLAAYDPELRQHFKVLADFDSDLDRSPQTEMLVARVVASVARRSGLRPLDRGAVARVLEQGARLADHAGKLTLLLEEIRDLLAEADFRAEESGHTLIEREDVQEALDERMRRAGRLRDRALESILQNVALIDTAGTRVGQVNGLSVMDLGGFAFGRPTRITCQVRPGSGKVVDIEREVKLGGPVHSKGVLILSGFLAGRFALDTPMSLFASLVFEQSYGWVEGDSASCAELCALLSALADLPLRQDIAVTGSVNQHGEVQAIGGVNEKIEGFFDACRGRGLTGSQGVLIPRPNVQHLMLRRDVVEACANERFAVYAVGSIDEGMALLTDCPAGVRGADGRFPEGSINRRVEDRLRSFASVWRSFAEKAGHDRER